MKIGVSVWAFPTDWPLTRIFSVAKEAGFDGVEVSLSEDGEINLNSTEENMQTIKRMAAEYRIELYSVASGLYWNYSLTSNKAHIRQKAKKIAKKQINVAKWLNCETILVIPGSVGIDFIPDSEIIEYDTAYERILSIMNELKMYAEHKGITIGLENVWNKFLLSPLEIRDLIDQIGSRFVGSYFDVGNVISNGYPEHWIKILGSRIKKIHFKDYRKSIGTIDGFVDLLSGDVNYPAVLEELKKIGYDGWVTAEVGYDRDNPEESAFHTAQLMQKILKPKEERIC